MDSWVGSVLFLLFLLIDPAFSQVSSSHCDECASLHHRRLVEAYSAFERFINSPLRKPNPSCFDLLEPVTACELESRNKIGDGPKWICGVDLISEPCIIYSLGSSREYSFEEAIVDNHCELHVYDPTVGDITAEIRRKFNGMFHAEWVDQNQKTFTQILADNGHTNKTVDIIKMDIEFAEYGVFEEYLPHIIDHQLPRPDQILVEMHFNTKKRKRKREGEGNCNVMKKTAKMLHEAGMLMFHKERNSWAPSMNGCVEFAYHSINYFQKVFYATHCPTCPRPEGSRVNLLHKSLLAKR